MQAPEHSFYCEGPSNRASLNVWGGSHREQAIQAWRAAHRITEEDSRQFAEQGHVCGASCSFDHTGGEDFVCRATGLVHICGEAACNRREPDVEGEQLLCPISGRAWPLVLGEEDLAGPLGADGSEDGNEEGEGEQQEEDGHITSLREWW